MIQSTTSSENPIPRCTLDGNIIVMNIHDVTKAEPDYIGICIQYTTVKLIVRTCP